MLAFAGSTLRLAEIVRQSGRAVDAVNELWPLVAGLETRVMEGRADRDLLVLLAHARLSLGVALGHALPEEQLTIAARWTARAWTLARDLGDPALQAHALRMHGNELRKCGHRTAAVGRLIQAATMTTDPTLRGATLGLLARASSEIGNAALFDNAITQTTRLLDRADQHTMLFNPFSIREIHLRGLLATGRTDAAIALATGDGRRNEALSVAPQWRVLDQVTVGATLLADGALDGGVDTLRAAVTAAVTYRLPHQVQRVIRLLEAEPTDATTALRETARTMLDQLRRQLTVPTLA